RPARLIFGQRLAVRSERRLVDTGAVRNLRAPLAADRRRPHLIRLRPRLDEVGLRIELEAVGDVVEAAAEDRLPLERRGRDAELLVLVDGPVRADLAYPRGPGHAVVVAVSARGHVRHERRAVTVEPVDRKST